MTDNSAVKRRAVLIGIDRYLFPEIPDLRGCVNDAIAFKETLKKRYGFEEDNITCLLNERATREAILNAWDKIIEEVGPEDIVVIGYSGHGSQMTDREGDEPDGLDETIVPYDSGRQRGENRDITDDEIYWRLLRLCSLIPHVSLVMDCCHSGTLTRDVNEVTVRHAVSDLSPIAFLPVSPLPAEVIVSLKAAGTRGTEYGWKVLGERVTLIAGCRSGELSHEFQTDSGTRHGAMTFFLLQELEKMGPGSTFRDVFEKMGVRVNAKFPLQHPQLEGDWDREIFGSAQVQPEKYVLVTARQKDRVTLAAGVIQGIQFGSRWRVHRVREEVDLESGQVGELEVESVGVMESQARILTEIEGVGIEPGFRAVETARLFGSPKFKVRMPTAMDIATEAVFNLLQASVLLDVAPQSSPCLEDTPDAFVHLLSSKDALVSSHVLPERATANFKVWAVTGANGRLLMAPFRAGEESAGRLLVNLERIASYDLALRLQDPGGLLAGRVSFRLLRQHASGEWLPAVSSQGEPPVFQVGERLAFEMVNRSPLPVYITILDFGISKSIGQVYPWTGSAQLLERGVRFLFGTAPTDAMVLTLPSASTQFLPSEQSNGYLETFRLLATSSPTDFSFLFQPGIRNAPRNPLEKLMHAAITGGGARELVPLRATDRDEIWTLVDQSLSLRK